MKSSRPAPVRGDSLGARLRLDAEGLHPPVDPALVEGILSALAPISPERVARPGGSWTRVAAAVLLPLAVAALWTLHRSTPPIAPATLSTPRVSADTVQEPSTAFWSEPNRVLSALEEGVAHEFDSLALDVRRVGETIFEGLPAKPMLTRMISSL